MTISLKSKLTMSFLAIILISGVVTVLAAAHLIGRDIIRQAQEKVTYDLRTARTLYAAEVDRIRDVLRFAAGRFFLKDAITARPLTSLALELNRIRDNEALDVLTLTDARGIVLVRSRNPALAGDDQTCDPLVARVLAQPEVAAGSLIVPEEQLRREGVDLAEQARLEVLATPRAKAAQAVEHRSGMMIGAAAPVWDRDGLLLGVLYGGRLLNRNYDIVDRVKRTVYQGIQYQGKDIGTATVFQGDVRISTNVVHENGERAIGTRASAAVHDRVLVQGLPWIGRAFVVNGWYIAAYEPIVDLNDSIIGMLYVGVLQDKYKDLQKRAMAVFLGITLATTMVTLLLSLFLAHHILHPVKGLTRAAQQWSQGNLDYQVTTKGDSELSRLGSVFNQMASCLQKRDEQLREYSDRQIMKSERLATVGQLAAGLAHEINNPLGAVLMYTHLTLETLAPGDQKRENLEKVIGEITRCKDIVKGLLDFARQTELNMEVSDIHRVLACTLSLVENLALMQGVRVVEQYTLALPRVLMDVSQMQQVFTNIILNAAEAMGGQGVLTVSTHRIPDQKGIEIVLADTGCGISQENLEKVFDPFFTTKEVGQGTGLGLAVSYGIVTRHRGTIDVQSELGRGSRFVVRLPLTGGA